jgi:hypothetical protein
MASSTSLSRRRFTRTTAGLALGTLLAGCSGGSDSTDDGNGGSGSGGGCSTPAANTAPREYLPQSGGDFERVRVSDDSLQDEGETAVLGAYSGPEARYSVIIYRFAESTGATDYKERLIEAARIQNDSAYAVLVLGNFVFIGMAEGSAGGGDTLSQVKRLLGRSPVISESCVTDRNALPADLRPGTPA